MARGFGMCGPVPYDIDAINVDAWQSILNMMPEGPCTGKLNTRLWMPHCLAVRLHQLLLQPNGLEEGCCKTESTYD